MPLSTEEQQQLDTIFQNQNVRDIILSIQLYFLSDKPDKEYASKLATKEIKKAIKHKYSDNIIKNLEVIIDHVLTCLMNQQELFLNQLRIDVFKEYHANLKQNKPTSFLDIFNTFFIRLQKIYKNYHYGEALAQQNTSQIFAIRLKLIADFFLNQANKSQLESQFLKSIGLAGMAFCAYLGVSNLYYDPSTSFQIRNVIMFTMALCYYLYYTTYKYELRYIELFIESLKENATPTLGLHKIEFIDLQTKQEIKSVYLPINPEQAITHLEQQIAPEKIVNKIRPQKNNQQYIAQVPRLLNSVKILLWPNKTLLKNPKEEWISSDSEDVLNMQGLHYPKTRYYSFFNKKALEKQIKINPESLPYKNYHLQWNGGVIVPPKGHSGNKKLPIPYGTTIGEPILEKKAPKQWLLFKWELKTKGEDYLDRCYGTECSTIMSVNGDQHTLIDYCYHKSGGLH